MRYLIDTQIFVRIHTREYGELSEYVVDILTNCENLLYISSESIREIALLCESGRIGVKEWGTFDGLKSSLEEHGIEIKYVNESHLKTLFKLRRADKHHDPSDLMIVAQAITEKIPLVSTDTKFPSYTTQGLHLISARRTGRRK